MPNGMCPRCGNSLGDCKSYCRQCWRDVNNARRERRKQQFASGELAFPDFKECRECGIRKSSSAFSPSYAAADGLLDCCKQCNSRDVTKSNKQRKYGMDESAIIRFIAEQGGSCAICRVTIVYGERKNNFHIDHDHATGAVRGILCPTCNVGLGKLNDDPEVVGAAILYLRRTEGMRHVSRGGESVG